MSNPRQSPVYRNIAVTNLIGYRLPAPGVASILHRISGVALFVSIPVLLGLLQMSLKSEAGFAAFRSMIWGNALAKLILCGLLWAMIYHTFAGVRHMIQDKNKWLDLPTSTSTAIGVMVASVVVTLMIVWRVW